MVLSVLANPALAPCMNKLLPLYSHDITVTYLSTCPKEARRQLRTCARNAVSGDTILLLEGADLLSETPWENGEGVLCIPYAHNIASLLLGADDVYRNLFLRYDGSLCWFLPGAHRELCLIPHEDCHQLCALVDTQLDLPQETLSARTIAQYNEWDFFEIAIDFSLIESLIGNACNAELAMVFAPGEQVSPR